MKPPGTIAAASTGSGASRDPAARRPVMVRVPPDMLERIDRAARRLGLSRAAFMLSTTVKELERMES